MIRAFREDIRQAKRPVPWWRVYDFFDQEFPGLRWVERCEAKESVIREPNVSHLSSEEYEKLYGGE